MKKCDSLVRGKFIQTKFQALGPFVRPGLPDIRMFLIIVKDMYRKVGKRKPRWKRRKPPTVIGACSTDRLSRPAGGAAQDAGHSTPSGEDLAPPPGAARNFRRSDTNPDNWLKREAFLFGFVNSVVLNTRIEAKKGAFDTLFCLALLATLCSKDQSQGK